jgi:hypothetical protein
MSEAIESFGVLLREKMAELDADEASHLLIADDPVERLRLDARQVVLSDDSAPMPRPGHRAYTHPPVSGTAEPSPRRLDLRT